MADPDTSHLFTELQKQCFGGQTVSSSCQTELQELMRQIDLMVSGKRKHWEKQVSQLESTLKSRDEQLKLQYVTLQLKQNEIDQLTKNNLDNECENCNENQKEMIREYEEKMSGLQAEVGKMKHDYEKLSRRFMKHNNGQKIELHKQLRCTVDELTGTNTRLLSDNRNLNEDLKQTKARIRELEQEITGLLAELETHQRDLNCSKTKELRLSQDLSRLENLLRNRQQNISTDKEQHSQTDNNNCTQSDGDRLQQLKGQLRTAQDFCIELEAQLRLRNDECTKLHGLITHKRSMDRCVNRLSSTPTDFLAFPSNQSFSVTPVETPVKDDNRTGKGGPTLSSGNSQGECLCGNMNSVYKLPKNLIEPESPQSRSSAVENFLIDEQERILTLESLLNQHVEDFKHTTDLTMRNLPCVDSTSSTTDQ